METKKERINWQFITLLVAILGLILTTFIATYVRIDTLNDKIGEMEARLTQRIDAVHRRIDAIQRLLLEIPR